MPKILLFLVCSRVIAFSLANFILTRGGSSIVLREKEREREEEEKKRKERRTRSSSKRVSWVRALKRCYVSRLHCSDTLIVFADIVAERRQMKRVSSFEKDGKK